MTEHTKLPWAYRPNEFDDWGWIRGPKEDGISPLAAIARGSSDIDHEEHRRNGTDPYAANAALIVQAVNSYPEMREALDNIFRAATYPVSTEIDPRGFAFRSATKDLLELIVEFASIAGK